MSFSIFAPPLAILLSALVATCSREPTSRSLVLFAGSMTSLLLALRLWFGPRIEPASGFSSNSFSLCLSVVVALCLCLYFGARDGHDTDKTISGSVVSGFGFLVLVIIVSRDLLWMFVLGEFMAWGVAWTVSRANRGSLTRFRSVGPLHLVLSGGCLLVGFVSFASTGGSSDLAVLGGTIDTLSSPSSGGILVGSAAFVFGLWLRAHWFIRRFLRASQFDLSTACLGIALVLVSTTGMLVQWWAWLGPSVSPSHALVWWLGVVSIFWGGLSSLWRYSVRRWIGAAACSQFGFLLLGVSCGADGWIGVAFHLSVTPICLMSLALAFGTLPERGEHLHSRWVYVFAVASLAAFPATSGLLAKLLVGAAVFAGPVNGLSIIGLGLFALALSGARLLSRTVFAPLDSVEHSHWVQSVHPARSRRSRIALGVGALLLVWPSVWPQPWLAWAYRAASSVF